MNIRQARNLTAKDPSFGKKKTSDPYAVIYWGGEKLADTKVIDNNLNPKWNEIFRFKVGSNRMAQLLRQDSKYKTIDIVVFDKDRLTKDEPLGTVSIPTNDMVADGTDKTFPVKWYTLEKGIGPYPAKDASGEIELAYKIRVDRVENSISQIEKPLKIGEKNSQSTLKFKFRWSTSSGNDKKAIAELKEKLEKVDPHASAICLDDNLNLIDVVSFNDKESRDKAIIHTGKGENNVLEQKGEGLGGESIKIKLDKIHPKTTYICLVINSFKGRKMNKVLERYGIDLIDVTTNDSHGTIIMKDEISNPKLKVQSALLMGCLYRDPNSKAWTMQTIIQPAPGIITNQVVDVLQNIIHRTIPNACSQQVPIKHSSGPRANWVIEC